VVEQIVLDDELTPRDVHEDPVGFMAPRTRGPQTTVSRVSGNVRTTKSAAGRKWARPQGCRSHPRLNRGFDEREIPINCISKALAATSDLHADPAQAEDQAVDPTRPLFITS